MKLTSNLLVVLIAAVMLSGCLHKEAIKPNIIVSTEKLCISPPNSGKVSMRDVSPVAIQNELGIWYVGLTPKHYENISQNIDDALGAIKQKNAIIHYYKKCLEEDKPVPKDKEKKDDIR